MKTWNSNSTAILMMALAAAIALALTSCEKDELVSPNQPTFTEVAQIDAEPDGLGIVLDYEPVEEYYTVTSKLTWLTPDSLWTDTIKRTLIRPLSRWLEDGFYFVENRRDTAFVYHDGSGGIFMNEKWDFWTLED